MASGPTTSWQIDAERVETLADLIFWCSKITADGYCSHEIQRCLLLGRKAMTNLDSILKTEISLCQARSQRKTKAKVFPVVVNRCGCWTIKKTECQRIDTFEWWCWRRLLRVSWTARRSNQLVLQEINP